MILVAQASSLCSNAKVYPVPHIKTQAKACGYQNLVISVRATRWVALFQRHAGSLWLNYRAACGRRKVLVAQASSLCGRSLKPAATKKFANDCRGGVPPPFSGEQITLHFNVGAVLEPPSSVLTES